MTEDGRQKKRILLIIAALMVITLAAYEPVRHNDFVNYDDRTYIVNNPNIKEGITPESIHWALTKPYASNWHPLTWISHMLDYEIYGLNAGGHHITSVIIHTISSVLLFLVFWRMTRTIWPSAFAAAVFAVHPVHVESVAWAAERKDVLSGLFWILTMLAYVRYAQSVAMPFDFAQDRPATAKQPPVKPFDSAQGRPWAKYLQMVLFFALGLMSKPMVITLPIVLLVLDYWPLERFKNQKTKWLILEKIPLFAMSVFLGVMTIVSQRTGGSVIALERIPINYRIANALTSYIRYIGKTIWPSRLAVFYSEPSVILTDPKVVLCAILLVLITVICIFTARFKKHAITGWLWYIVTLLPIIGLVQTGLQAMANRYMYIPMTGLLIIIGWSIKDAAIKWPRLKGVITVIAAGLLLSLIMLTRIQVKHWKDSIALFEYTLKVTRNNALAEHNYGFALAEAGRLKEAEVHFKNALEIIPEFYEARNKLGKVLVQEGRPVEAADCFYEVIRQDKDTAETHYALSLALGMQNKYDEAIKHLAQSLKMSPDYPEARSTMAKYQAASRSGNTAISGYNEQLQQNADSAEAHYNLAVESGRQNKYEEAIKHLEKVIELEPNYPDAHNKMALALIATGRPDAAIEHFKEALRSDEKNTKLYVNLARIYQQTGKYDEAIKNWGKAAEMKPDDIGIINNYAWLLATAEQTSKQDAQKAIELAERACKLTGYKEAVPLDTLAAAYAASGRFKEASATAQRAIDAAKAAGQGEIAERIQKRLELYRAGKQFIQK